jgi:glycosyltransferase involved in cell wall biosynthesis
MPTHPFFTILTASLNKGTTLRKTLESIKNQTFRDFEHIVVDGNSYDETLDTLRQFETIYNLYWISEPDHGIADALNKGLAIAMGRYVLVIQADDQLLSPKSLENVYPLLRDEKFDIYNFPVILDHPYSGKVLLKPIRIHWWNRFKFIFLHQGCFVNQRVFKKIGGFRKQFSIALDYDFFYRALLHGFKVNFESYPVSLMGGTGIGSNQDFLMKRLKEEILVQNLNEKNPFWRIAQLIFRTFYLPFKIHLSPKLKNHF